MTIFSEDCSDIITQSRIVIKDVFVNEIMIVVFLALLLIVVVLLFIILRKSTRTDTSFLVPRLDSFEKAQERTERVVREELAQSREELGKEVREQRLELIEAFKTLGNSVVQRMTDVARMQKGYLNSFTEQLASFEKASGERLEGIRVESSTGAKLLREEVITALKGITLSTNNTMGKLANIQKIQLEKMAAEISNLSDSNEKKLVELRNTVENKLQIMQIDNAKQLEKMRQTVDEKLQGSLERRLGESFKQVSERLELVHKGLGEMKTLATGVGDLKKVLTNVKIRGTWGEVQLGVLLEQVLTPHQYSTNVATKGGGERVEFAIKLPGQVIDKDEIVWLPIDAKFPVEDYQRLIESQEKADVEGIAAAGKQLENSIKNCARDISRKYLNPPKTTDFGILFLPIESLFAEVIQRTGLTEVIQREFRVVIAGPTTLWSILSSLQMGFRTLAIQERSSEVWNLLAAVKTEWTKYGDILDLVQNKILQASDTIEKVKVRSRAIGRKLKEVQELPSKEATALLPGKFLEDDERAVKIDGTVVE